MNEAYLELETRLVAYLNGIKTGGALADLAIYPGHGDANLDNIASWFSIYAERADTQLYWQGGLEIVDVKGLLVTQADDTSLLVHNSRVVSIRGLFDLRQLPVLKAALNATPGFGLSGWRAGKPPIEDGFDAKDRRRQALFRWEAVVGMEIVDD